MAELNRPDRLGAVIFDFFGVICSEIAPFWLQRYFPLAEAATIKATVVAAADSGDLSEADLFQRLGARAGMADWQAKREWQEYVRIDEEVVCYIKALRQAGSGPLGLLSNSPSPFLRDILRDHGLEPLFDDIVVSSEVGIAKPAKEVFLMAADRLNVAPSSVTFIDDNPVNVSAAQELGMVGVLFTSLPRLKSTLNLRA